jgi:hypothetical protein
MSSTNVRTAHRQNITGAQFNHNSLKVKPISSEAKLVRMTMAHMLFEKQFYVDGEDSYKTLQKLINEVSPEFVANVAKKARNEFKLRHVPLALMRGLAKNGTLKAQDLADVIQRPDELSQFLAIYWKDGKQPISNQAKKGLALAFGKFNEYQLAKYDRNSSAISIRDTLFLSHPKPENKAQELLFKKIANKQLKTPDTWEVQLSAGADKAETFTRLMSEKKLGALAFLRNLRNMLNTGAISEETIVAYGDSLAAEKVLPFRYVAAYRSIGEISSLEIQHMLERMMMKSLAAMPKLPGKTVLMVDVSGSMFGAKVSAKSDLDRFDAAASLAIMCREICEKVEIYTFSDKLAMVNPYVHGFALIEALQKSQPIAGTNFNTALNKVNQLTTYDRIISFTDEQYTDTHYTDGWVYGAAYQPEPKGRGYVVNVAAYEHGLSFGDKWLTISGFSEAVFSFIQAMESNEL